MASVVLPAEVARRFAGGEARHEIEARDVRELFGQLEARFPGIGATLRRSMAIAIDGEIFQDPFLEAIPAQAEVHFLPAIEGG